MEVLKWANLKYYCLVTPELFLTVQPYVLPQPLLPSSDVTSVKLALLTFSYLRVNVSPNLYYQVLYSLFNLLRYVHEYN